MTAAARTTIAANLRSVQARIDAACDRARRDRASVRLIAVSKTMPPELARAAIEAGVTDLGENYVQECAAKRAALGTNASKARWHLIGHLQSNKIRAALEAFDVIQTVDSIKLGEALDRRCRPRVAVFLEVNAAGEPSKYGFAPRDVAGAVAAISKMPNLALEGLMTIAPAVDDPSQVRPVFRALRELAEANGLLQLSMGMTGDFEAAIEEGATMVRIGRAIFGERTP